MAKSPVSSSIRTSARFVMADGRILLLRLDAVLHDERLVLEPLHLAERLRGLVGNSFSPLILVAGAR